MLRNTISSVLHIAQIPFFMDVLKPYQANIQCASLYDSICVCVARSTNRHIRPKIIHWKFAVYLPHANAQQQQQKK